MEDMAEIKAFEEAELLVQEQLAADIKWLQSNPQFKRVILDRYVRDTALDVGMSFTGSESDQETLKSISNLMTFLTNNSDV